MLVSLTTMTASAGRNDMDAHHTRWDDWSAEQWLEEALRFEKMARRFMHRPKLNASFDSLARDARRRAGPQAWHGRHSRPANGTEPSRHTSKDLDYFHRRAAEERTAAVRSSDLRVRRVHLEMAERYAGLVRALPEEPALRLVS
jgi:hypothetical protein